MKVEPARRAFSYNGIALQDPDPNLSAEDVRTFYLTLYPELASAAIEGPEQQGDVTTYTFRRAVGTKGNDEVATMVRELAETAALGTPGDPESEALMDELLLSYAAARIKRRLAETRARGRFGWWHTETLPMTELRLAKFRAFKHSQPIDAVLYALMLEAREAMPATPAPVPAAASEQASDA
jgi:PRTRC genetic system protein C